jgi:hypothetical protein
VEKCFEFSRLMTYRLETYIDMCVRIASGKIRDTRAQIRFMSEIDDSSIIDSIRSFILYVQLRTVRVRARISHFELDGYESVKRYFRVSRKR